MRVFVTGAGGHIGSVVVGELVERGHQVVDLARSETSAATVEGLGAAVASGGLTDLEVLRDAAAAADGVIHLAFDHEAMLRGDLSGASDTDLAAVRAMAEPLMGTGRPLIVTSGTGMLAPLGLGRAGTEDDAGPGGYRMDTENEVIAMADRGVRTAVVRLPPVVHSHLDHHGFVPMMIGSARAAGRSAYIGEGTNQWPAVHTLDAAHLYCLAVESVPAGTRLHAVGDEGIAVRAIAEKIGEHLGLPVESIDGQAANDHFGFLAPMVQLDNPTSAARTRALLDWRPARPGLLDDMDEGHYFAAGS